MNAFGMILALCISILVALYFRWVESGMEQACLFLEEE